MMNIKSKYEEFTLFNQLSDEWWNEKGKFKILHQIKSHRMTYILDQINNKNINKLKILDIGCGGGILSESLALEGATVVGIDLAEAGLEVAKLHLLESGLNIDYQFISAEELAQSEIESFDVITCLEMLEHVPDPSLIIEACSKLVKSNGRVFFSTINRNPKSYFFAIVGAEYVLNLLPKGTHNYEKFIRPSEIDGWARLYDLSISSMIGMTYNPITKKYKLDDDVSVNYIIHYEKKSRI